MNKSVFVQLALILGASLFNTSCIEQQSSEEENGSSLTLYSQIYKNGTDINALDRTEYHCSFFNPSGVPSGEYNFAFFEDGTGYIEMMEYPNSTEVVFSEDILTNTLVVLSNGNEVFEYSGVQLDTAGKLISFHHYCIYCASHDDARNCELQPATH